MQANVANITDSVNYLETVKAAVPTATYDEFVAILNQFRTAR
jgi:hypothetical protein